MRQKSKSECARHLEQHDAYFILYSLRYHPVVSEHGLGGVRIESRNRIDELHYESIRGVHALSYVSVACGLEDGATSNLLCKFEKREPLSRPAIRLSG